MAKAKVTITATNQMTKGIKAAEQELTSFQKVADKVGASLKTAFSAAAIVAVGKVIVKTAKECAEAYNTQLEAETKLENALRATNKQYEVSAQSLKKYAQQLQSTTRFGDDAIIEAEALLVATEKLNKDGLEKTIALSADLAEAMSTDISSAAQTLSKVLQDPTKGLDKLKTVGISFTAQEKEQIKALTEANELYKAQDIILEKVKGKYGGLAEAIASTPTGTLDKIKNTLSDIKEDIGQGIVNSLAPAFEWILKMLQKIHNWSAAHASDAEFYQLLEQGGTAQQLADKFSMERLTTALEEQTTNYRQVLQNFKGTNWGGALASRGISLANVVTKSDEQLKVYFEHLFGKGGETDELVTSAIEDLNEMFRPMISWQKKLYDAIKIQNGTYKLDEFQRQQVLEARASGAFALALAQNSPLEEFFKGNSSHNFNLNFGVGPSATLNAAYGMNGINVFAKVMSENVVEPIVEPIVSSLWDKLSDDQKSAFGSSVFSSLTDNLGEAGDVISKLATNMSTMGPLFGAIATALEYILQGFGQTIRPILDEVVKYGLEPLREIGRVLANIIKPILEELMPLFEDSADSFIGAINMIGQALAPLIRLITTVISPLLSQICNTLKFIEPVTKAIAKVFAWLVGTVTYIVEVFQHIGAVILNWIAGFHIGNWRPFEGIAVQDKGMPGDYNSYIKSYMSGIDNAGELTVNDASAQTAVSSAAYRGATSVTINIYAEGPVVGDGGLREFAKMIREEFDALNYYGVTA